MLCKVRFLLAFFLVASINVYAQQASENALVAQLFRALQMQDVEAYEKLYASTDSLSSWILQFADVNSESYRKMYFVKNNEVEKANYDTLIRKQIDANFDAFAKKAKTLGVHWDETVFVRYELEKIRRGRGLMIEKVAPLRFLGYVFFKDNFTRKMYAFTTYDIIQVNGKWYGGELVDIFRASNKEEYHAAYEKEQKRLKDIRNGVVTVKKDDADSTGNDEEDDRPSRMKEVVDRKYYKGKFDNEIEVQLYVRYIKGPCPGGVCSWEALFKFGDQEEWVPMSIVKNPEGKWLFTEDLGGMELTLEGGVYKGTWAAGDTKSEYDVKFKESDLSTKKANALDRALDEMDEPDE